MNIHNDGPDWVTITDMQAELEHGALIGAYVFMSNDSQLFALQTYVELDNANNHHRYCS